GQREQLCRPAPPALAPHRALPGLDQTIGEHRVEVAADSGAAQAERLTQLAGRGRPVLQQQLSDAVTGAPVRRIPIRGPGPVGEPRRVFHTPSVTYSITYAQTAAQVTQATVLISADLGVVRVV